MIRDVDWNAVIMRKVMEEAAHNQDPSASLDVEDLQPIQNASGASKI